MTVFACFRMSAGGARPGAGRKPRDVRKIAVTVRLEPEVFDMLELVRAIQCRSQSAQVAKLVTNAAVQLISENMEFKER